MYNVGKAFTGLELEVTLYSKTATEIWLEANADTWGPNAAKPIQNMFRIGVSGTTLYVQKVEGGSAFTLGTIASQTLPITVRLCKSDAGTYLGWKSGSSGWIFYNASFLTTVYIMLYGWMSGGTAKEVQFDDFSIYSNIIL